MSSEITSPDLAASILLCSVSLAASALTIPEKLVRHIIAIKIPANTKNGQKIRLKGYGVKNRKSEIYGDMYLIINVILPSIDELDLELKNMLENRL